MVRRLIILMTFFAFAKCGSPAFHDSPATVTLPPPSGQEFSINLAHIDHLYTEKPFNNSTIGLLHIYSEYPDYEYTIEPKEGFACVDDVARAIVLLSGEEGASERVRNMTEFLLQMQDSNGYFNNFIWGDLSINKTYKTSEAKPDWWSWRALWALETVYPHFKGSALGLRIDNASKRLVENILSLVKTTESIKMVEGIEVPTFLPYESAADQAAVMILGLIPHWERTKNKGVNVCIETLGKGIMKMQLGEKDHFPHGVFLSWENLWHAYGNNQSYALLKAGQSLKDSTFIDAALNEVDNFYPYLLEEGFAESMHFGLTAGNYILNGKKQFSQIAYGIRPMVLASCEAYRVTKNEKYRSLALECLKWFSGDNAANARMYDPSTGRCFDGIISVSEINKNSGAESTIEALLSIQAYLRIIKG